MRRVLPRQFVPPSLAGPVLTDNLGIPRYWAHAWLVMEGNHLKESTHKQMLAAAERLHDAFEARLGADCLDRVLAELDVRTILAVLQGVFLELRNGGMDAHINTNQIWEYASKFIVRILSLLTLARPSVPDTGELLVQIRQIDAHFRSVKPQAPRKPMKLRALPALVVENIYAIIDPESQDNPFRSDGIAFRNFVIVVLLLHLGLRRGELCLLALDAVRREIDPRTGRERYWLNIVELSDDQVESRADAPSLKTPYSLRQIPIAREMAQLLDEYVRDHRGNPPHTLLFSSQKRKPLAVNTLNYVFQVISRQLSPEAKKVLRERRSKPDVSTHEARHTAVVVRLTDLVDAGVPLPEALDMLKVFFGWSKESEMPLHYGRAYFEERLHMVWDRRWDTHVDYLRALESQGSV